MCINLSQFVRKLGDVLGHMHEEIEVAFEDELRLESYGACLPMFDVLLLIFY